MNDLTLTEIWHGATLATGCLADAICARGKEPAADVRAELVEAAERLSKATLELRQLLAARWF